MSNIPTPHIGATKKEEIAKTVLMPGDPLRAKLIAETFLENAVCFTTVRNMLGFTGTYKGKRVSVMGSGMGMPSIGIYSHELFNFYDVQSIIRIGSAGSLRDDVNLKDIVFAMGASTDSNYAAKYNLPGTYAPTATYSLLKKAVDVAEQMGIAPVVGNVLSEDIFYHEDPTVSDRWRDMGIIALEMESAALYMEAARASKKALCMLTISDHIYKGLSLSAMERQESFREMMKIALEVAE